MDRKIPAEDSIVLFIKCKKCADEQPENMTQRDWFHVEAGWTEIGLQVRCLRHNCNIIHIDFENLKHPANYAADDTEE